MLAETIKKMRDKVDDSRGRKKYELTQDYKSYAGYDFPNDETCHPRCENAADSVLCTQTNDECQYPDWKCVLRECTACTSIDLPGVERDSSNRAPMITFNKYMTQFDCSHYGILIREKITTFFDAKGTYKKTFLLCTKLIQAKTPYFTRGILYVRLKLFSIKRNIGDFQKNFIFNKLIN